MKCIFYSLYIYVSQSVKAFMFFDSVDGMFFYFKSISKQDVLWYLRAEFVCASVFFFFYSFRFFYDVAFPYEMFMFCFNIEGNQNKWFCFDKS